MDGDADRFVEARYRSLQESSLDRNRVGYADPWWWGVAAAGRKGYRGKSNAGD